MKVKKLKWDRTFRFQTFFNYTRSVFGQLMPELNAFGFQTHLLKILKPERLETKHAEI